MDKEPIIMPEGGINYVGYYRATKETKKENEKHRMYQIPRKKTKPDVGKAQI